MKEGRKGGGRGVCRKGGGEGGGRRRKGRGRDRGGGGCQTPPPASCDKSGVRSCKGRLPDIGQPLLGVITELHANGIIDRTSSPAIVRERLVPESLGVDTGTAGFRWNIPDRNWNRSGIG